MWSTLLFSLHCFIDLCNLRSIFRMKPVETTSRRRKLVDYTKEGRPDMPCNRGTPCRDGSISRDSARRSLSPRRKQSASMNIITESNHSVSSFISASSSSFSLEEDYEEEQVEFFLKIPSRKRTTPSSGISRRKDLMRMCEQQSQQSRRRASTRSLTSKEARQPSWIDSVLHHEDVETILMRRELSKKGAMVT